MLPVERIAIVTLTNASPIGLAEAVCRSFLDLCLAGKIERDWIALFGEAMAKAIAPDYGTSIDYAKPPIQSLALAASAYAGRYHSDLFGPIEISGSDAALVLKVGPKLATFALRHFARDVFTYQPVGENAYGPSAVTFTVGPDGKATVVTIENLDTNRQGIFSRS